MDAKQKAVIDLVLNGQQAQTSLREVTRAATALRREINGMREADNPELYKQRVAEMNKMLAIQQKMRAEINGTATGWQKVIGQIGTITTGILGAGAVQSVLNQFSMAKTKVIEYKDELADVQKATNMTAQEAADLNEELQKMKTRTPTKELSEMAVVAGQFGVAKQEVDEFVESADKLNIALGDEFNGVEDLSKSVLTMRNIFTDVKSQKIDDDLLHIGNALNFLSGEGAATAPVMADFSSRIGGTLIPLGLSSAKVLGYAATLQELNVTAERGSTALVTIFQKMLTETETFAKVAGVPLKEYKDLIGKDINAAFLKYVAGLQKVSGNQTEFMSVLEKSKLTGAGEMEVLSKLSTNMSLLGERTDQAGKALTSTDSVLGEFAKRNYQLAQDLKTLDEAFDNLYQSQAVQDFMGGAVHKAVELLDVLPKAYQWLKDNTTVVMSFVYAIAMLNAGLIKATLASWANTTAVIANRVAYQVGFQWLVLQTTAMTAYSTIMAGVTLRIRIATAAQLLWNAVLNANPIGLVITGLSALAYAVKTYSDNTAEALRLEREKIRLQREIQLMTERHTGLLLKFNEQLENYTRLSVAERAELVKSIAMARLEVESNLARTKAKEKQLELLAAEPSLWQKLWLAIASGGNTPAMAQQFARQAAENMLAVREQFAGNIQGQEDQLKRYDEIFKRIGQYEQPTMALPGTGKSPLGEDKKSTKLTQAQKDTLELENLLADSRQRVMTANKTEYEREVAAFAEHYSEMYKLAKDDEAKINEIRTLSLLEWAQIEKRFNEKQKEQSAKDIKDAKDLAEQELVNKRQLQLQSIQGQEQANAISPDAARMAELQAENVFLLAKKALYDKYFADILKLNIDDVGKRNALAKEQKDVEADIQKELTRVIGQQVDARLQYADAADQKELASHQARKQAIEGILQETLHLMQINWTEQLDGIKTFWQKATILQKAAFIASKAYSAAEASIAYGRTLMNIWATSGSPWAAVGFTALATATYGSVLAKIASTDYTIPQFAEGGSTAMAESSKPEGWIKQPTLFNLGKRSWIGGEAGEEYVISYPMLKNPAIANLVPALEAIRMGRTYASGGSTAMDGSGSSLTMGMSDAVGRAILLQLQLGNQLTQQQIAATGELAKRKINNNYFSLKDVEAEVDHIQNVTKL
ncbi:phage tail tape measure protein [Spirosoma litoris]